MTRSKDAIFRSLIQGLLLLAVISFSDSAAFTQQLPKLVLVGDSTVNNSSGDFRGWGNTTVDHTHTSLAGARVNAESLVEGLRKVKGLHIDRFLINR